MTTALTTAPFNRFRAAALQLIDAKRSLNTRKAYTRDLDAWIEFCANHAIDPLAPALGHATAFRDGLDRRELSNETIRRVLASLASIYKVLLVQGLARANPFHPAVLAYPPANTLGKTEIVDDAVARAMIAEAQESPRDAAILQLLYDTGLRRESVATIKLADIKPPRLRVVIKGGSDKELTLPPASLLAIERHVETLGRGRSPYLFSSRHGETHIALNMINRIVKRYGKAVGAPDVHPHCFRAAFATAGYDAGLPEYEIQAALGHKDPKTTRRYDRGSRGATALTKLADFRSQRKQI